MSMQGSSGWGGGYMKCSVCYGYGGVLFLLGCLRGGCRRCILWASLHPVGCEHPKGFQCLRVLCIHTHESGGWKVGFTDVARRRDARSVATRGKF